MDEQDEYMISLDLINKSSITGGWRDGVKSTCCSSKEFDSKQPQGSLQQSVIPVLGTWCLLLASVGTRHTHGTQTYL